MLQFSISKFLPLQKASGVVGGGLEQSRVRIRKPTPQLWLQELQLLQSDHALTPNKDCGEKSMHTYLSRPWFFPCKKLQDSLGFWTPRRGFRIPGTGFQSLSVKLRFWILIVSGIPDSTFQYFGFHKQNFPECRITRAKISRIPEPAFPYVGRHDSKRYCGFLYQICFHCLVFIKIFIRTHEHRQHLGLRYRNAAKWNSRLPVIGKTSVSSWNALKNFQFTGKTFWFKYFKHLKTKSWVIFSTYRIYQTKLWTSNKPPPRITTHRCCRKLWKFKKRPLSRSKNLRRAQGA